MIPIANKSANAIENEIENFNVWKESHDRLVTIAWSIFCGILTGIIGGAIYWGTYFFAPFVVPYIPKVFFGGTIFATVITWIQMGTAILCYSVLWSGSIYRKYMERAPRMNLGEKIFFICFTTLFAMLMLAFISGISLSGRNISADATLADAALMVIAIEGFIVGVMIGANRKRM